MTTQVFKHSLILYYWHDCPQLALRNNEKPHIVWSVDIFKGEKLPAFLARVIEKVKQPEALALFLAAEPYEALPELQDVVRKSFAVQDKKKTQQQKCRDKFALRWSRKRFGVNDVKKEFRQINIYPFGYNTKRAFIHEQINRRASIAKDIEGTKNMIWRCNALPYGVKCADFNQYTLLQTNLAFPDTNIKTRYFSPANP